MHRTSLMLALLAGLLLAAPAADAERYRNPLTATIPGGGDRVETFADPHIQGDFEQAGFALYTGYWSVDGRRRVRGGTWTHDLPGARLGLFAMGGPGGDVAEFDDVRVSRPAR